MRIYIGSGREGVDTDAFIEECRERGQYSCKGRPPGKAGDEIRFVRYSDGPVLATAIIDHIEHRVPRNPPPALAIPDRWIICWLPESFEDHRHEFEAHETINGREYYKHGTYFVGAGRRHYKKASK